MRLIMLVVLMTLTVSSRAVSQERPADDAGDDGLEVVHPEDGAATEEGETVDDSAAKVKKRVRPEELMEVPAGIVLRPRGDDNRRTVFRPDQEYKCFIASEWGHMGHLITDYRWLWYYGIQMEMKVARLEQQIGNLQIQLTIWKHNTSNAEQALKNMTGLLNKEHAWRTNLERRERKELWLWRAGTVVGLALAGGLGIAWGVSR